MENSGTKNVMLYIVLLFSLLALFRSVSAQDTIIEVDPATVKGKISPDLFGVNHRYVWNAFGMWDAANQKPYPLFLKRFKDVKIRLVRFPAGTMGNLYQWKRAIGPFDKRENCVATIPKDYEGPVTNEFGPDEYGKFLEETGAHGVIMINAAGNSNAREAADLVEYMNGKVQYVDGKWIGENRNGGIDWAALRADANVGNHPEPYNIRYWEIGNEMNLGTIQSYWIGLCSDDPFFYTQKYCLGGYTTFI